MGDYIINGGKKISGEVLISGSKNAVLPILSATLINGCESVLHNCPNISDVTLTIEILSKFGVSVKKEGNTLVIDSSNVTNAQIPKQLADKMRSSILFLGVLLGKFKKVTVFRPGGCKIGERGIDLHLTTMQALGAEIKEHDNLIECSADELIGTTINLPFASVGATENLMLAGVYAKGQTIIHNAAREPEIFALQEYLKSIGVQIRGAGTQTIIINHCEKFNSAEIDIIPDRIEAGTFLTAAAITKGDVLLKNTNWMHMSKTLKAMSDCGCEIKIVDDTIHLKAPKKIKSIELLRTGIYPDLPTDMQPAFMALLTTCKGTSIIIEQMFENRFNHARELNKMGANISAQTRVAIIDGVKKLQGCKVCASDLRAGAALIVAGLSATGVTTVSNAHFIKRGYENIELKLRSLGANIIYSDGVEDEKY